MPRDTAHLDLGVSSTVLKNARPAAFRYFPALVTPLLAALVSSVTWPLFKDVPFAVVIILVIFTAWYGGLWPGLLSFCLSFFVVAYFFVEPYYSFSTHGAFGLVRVAAIIAASVSVCFVCELLHRERRLAEKNLEAATISESLYRTLFDSAPDGIVITGPAGRQLNANPAMCRMLGYSRDELLALEAADIVTQSEIPQIGPAIETIRSRIDYFREWQFRRKDGTIFPAEVIATEMTDGNLLGMVRDVTDRKAAEAEIRNSTERLRALSARLNDAREEEGKRIAREIHDELGGALTALKWDIEGIDKALADTHNDGQTRAVFDKLAGLSHLIDSTIYTVRRIASDLRPAILDDLGLVPTIDWQTNQFKNRTGIECTFAATFDPSEVSREKATAVFRIFQEVLTNIIRHARASRVNIELSHDDGWLVLQVKDDGRGITEAEKADVRSLGLLGMKERARLVGGVVEISGEPGHGTTVAVRVPMAGKS